MERTRIRSALRRLRPPRASEGLSILLALALLVALEAVGRRLPAEWGVLPATAAACALAVALVRATRGGRLRWPGRLASRAARGLRGAGAGARRLMVRGGVDLRRVPPLERALPGLLLAGAPLPWLAAGAAVAAGETPHRVLEALAGRLFLLHWLSLAGLWLVALGMVLILALIAAGGLHDLHFEPRRRAAPIGRERDLLRQREYAVQTLLVLGVSFVAFVLPPSWLLALAAAGLALSLASLAPPLGPDLDLAWTSGSSTPVHGCSFLGAMALRLVLWSGLVAFVAAGALGPAAWDPELAAPVSPLVLTPLVGQLLAGWAAAAALVGSAMVVQGVALPRLAFARAVRADRVLRVGERPDPRTAAQLTHSLRGTGHAVRFGRAERRAGDLRVPLRTALRLALAASGDRWERPDLVDLRARLERRAERLHRRAVRRALRRAFAEGRREAPERAEGLWLGPQHWFERAATCPTSGEPGGGRAFDADVGPPFASLLDWRSRVYWAGLCRRLEIDHLFVERGLEPAALVAALELLFEVDDVFGGRSRLEERHLRALPGVRAMLHELPGEDLRVPRGYPEPSYDELARARVLHLFVDRGGDAERRDLGAPRRSRPLNA